jgi:hypothetical protein
MLRDEYCIWHLTEKGWIVGDFKLYFQKEIKIALPQGTLLSRRYFESLGHPNILIERGIENLGAISSTVARLLKKFPHPTGFERFRNIVFSPVQLV